MDLAQIATAFVGTIPGFLTSIVIALLTLSRSRRNNEAVEVLKTQLQQDTTRRAKWHDKQIAAVEEVYGAFDTYLDFLRRTLYPTADGPRDLTDMHIIRKTLLAQSLYLSDELTRKCWAYEQELVLFWTWAMTQRGDEAGLSRVRHQLDTEIPRYLPRLKADINAFIIPQAGEQPLPESNLGTPKALPEWRKAAEAIQSRIDEPWPRRCKVQDFYFGLPTQRDQ